MKYLTRSQSQVELAKLNLSLPVVKGGEAGVSDASLLTIQKSAAAAKYFQLYLDQALPPATGSVINDSVQGIFAGTLTPEQAAERLRQATV